MKRVLKFVTGLCVMAVTSSMPAHAATQTFSLSLADSGANLLAGPYGTVTVAEQNGTLVFTETLLNGFRIHAGNANHDAFAFSLTGDPSVQIDVATAGFAADYGPVAGQPFGSFDYGIGCTTACGPGYNGGFTGTLSFTVTALSNSGALLNTLSLASLAYNNIGGSKVYFTSDVVGSNGNTGNVGGVLVPQGAVPEPASWAMFILGFGVIGAALRSRRKEQPELN